MLGIYFGRGFSMNRSILTAKRLILYIIGIFFIALGATFSILANLGVSPVTSLPYAFALISGTSMGVMTVLANFLFIIIQAILLKEIKWRNFSIQIIIAFAFGTFMDVTLWITSFLPEARSIWLIALYLLLSLVIVAAGLLFYFTAKLPIMPYDALTYVVANKWKLPFGKAKITSDLLNVMISLILCLLALHSFGAIGIGTFIAAYGIGKITGIFLKKFQPALQQWTFKGQEG